MTFSTATLTFLRGLKRHNDRAWFEGHRAEYEAVVQQPMRHLIEEMDVRLARLAPEIVGDPKRSLFRIYRDIRFSADKSPYKTHAAWFGGLSDEAVLRRVPRGFAPDHPAARWLKFQSFVMGRALTDAQVVSARLPALLEADFRLMLPLVQWINGVLGLRAAERR